MGDTQFAGGGIGNKIDFEWIDKNPEVTAQLLRMDLLYFISVFHRHIHFTDFIVMPFHKKIVKKLEDIAFGRNKKKNLYIGLAPRLGKTELMTYFIAWSYALNPACNFIATSYSEELASGISGRVQKIVESPLFYKLFGVRIQTGSSAKTLWSIEGGGSFRAAPLMGGITGFGAGIMGDGYGGCVVIDDYLKPADANSKTLREYNIEIYKNTIKSRRNSPNTPIVVTAQRLTKDDMIGWIMQNEPEDWDFFILPTLNEETGKSIWEKQIRAEDLFKMKKDNPYVYYAQYQQDPRAMGGGIIKQEWFRFYDTKQEYTYKRLIITADTASKKNEWNDFTAIGLWGITSDNNMHLIDLIHAKFEADELERSMMMMLDKYKKGVGSSKRRVSAVYIEDKGSGTSLQQRLRRRVGVPVIGIKVVADKLTRLQSAIPYLSEGKILLPEGERNAMSNRILMEASEFSADMSHKHDDLIDMMVYAIEFGLARRGII